MDSRKATSDAARKAAEECAAMLTTSGFQRRHAADRLAPVVQAAIDSETDAAYQRGREDAAKVADEMAEMEEAVPAARSAGLLIASGIRGSIREGGERG